MSGRCGGNQRSNRSIVTTSPRCETTPSRTRARTMAIVAQPRRRLDKRDTVLGLDLDPVASAQAEDEPATGELVDGGRGHPDGGGAPHEHARDTRAEPDLARLDAAGAEDRELELH